jgi:hypothetical protein
MPWKMFQDKAKMFSRMYTAGTQVYKRGDGMSDFAGDPSGVGVFGPRLSLVPKPHLQVWLSAIGNPSNIDFHLI